MPTLTLTLWRVKRCIIIIIIIIIIAVLPHPYPNAIPTNPTTNSYLNPDLARLAAETRHGRLYVLLLFLIYLYLSDSCQIYVTDLLQFLELVEL